MPCEYSISPRDLKLYVPNKDDYSRSTLGCDRLRFLIIEPDNQNTDGFQTWYGRADHRTILLEQTEIGGVKIEKRRLKRQEEVQVIQ